MRLSFGILSGGKSKRFGKDKALASFNEKTFLEYLIDEFKYYGDLYLSGPIYKYNFLKEIIILEDTFQNKGPMTGIYEILKNSKTDWNFIVAVDMPFIDLEFLDPLVKNIEEDYEAIIYLDGEQKNPLCALYHRDIVPKLEYHLKNNKLQMMAFLDTLKVKYIPIHSSNRNKLLNINTLEDYKKLEKIVFAISGIKNSGKTTFIENILREFIKRGKKVSVLKSDGHEFNLKDEGTDTGIFRKAGAKEVGIRSRSKFQYISESKSLEETINHFNNYDILILEGFKDSIIPKFEIIRKNNSDQSVTNFKNTIGVITDHKKNFHINQFDFHEISKFCDFVEFKFQNKEIKEEE